jgi:Holliday junction DNA helicase RuvA
VIASVRGEVLERRPDHVVIEAAGVGYRLAISTETLRAVPASGKETTLHAHLVARDDSMQLFGFATEEERDLFLNLISVSGIGPKVGLAILSGGSPRELRRAIALGDHKRFQATPGIGKRTAERVIVELRERIAEELEVAGPESRPATDEPHLLAREGLINLGYSLDEAERLLSGVEGETAEDLIGAALRHAGTPEAA